MEQKAMELSEKHRLRILGAGLPLLFILSVFIAKGLWLSSRLYPLSPALPLFSLPLSADYLLSPILIFFLFLAAIFPKRKTFLITAIILIALLFLEDQGRLFPSFYEYFLLLLIVASYRPKAGDESADRPEQILNACRLAIAFVYISAGIEKINPLFVNELSWLASPLKSAMPSIQTFIPALAVIVPFIEIAIGFGLLFKRARRGAFFLALLMHIGLFFLIGPFRNDWNDSAWAWNAGSGILLFILFFKADRPSARDIFFGKKIPAHAIALLFFGILPAFGLFNLWDAPLSFDVYSGNYALGQIFLGAGAQKQIPEAIRGYADPASGSFNLDQWSLDAFGAHPYPAERIYKNILKSMCRYAGGASADVRLIVREKLKIFEAPQWLNGPKYFDCRS